MLALLLEGTPSAISTTIRNSHGNCTKKLAIPVRSDILRAMDVSLAPFITASAGSCPACGGLFFALCKRRTHFIRTRKKSSAHSACATLLCATASAKQCETDARFRSTQMTEKTPTPHGFAEAVAHFSAIAWFVAKHRNSIPQRSRPARHPPDERSCDEPQFGDRHSFAYVALRAALNR